MHELWELIHIHITGFELFIASAVYATDSVPESMKKAREESTIKLFTRSLEICRGKMVRDM